MRISDWSSDVCSSDLLRGTAVGMLGVHADADGLEHLGRRPTPQPGTVHEVGKSGSSLGVASVTSGAIVAEQRMSRLTNVLHEGIVGLDGGKFLLFDAPRPDGTPLGGCPQDRKSTRLNSSH